MAAGPKAARQAAVGQDLRDLRNALSSRPTEASRSNCSGRGKRNHARSSAVSGKELKATCQLLGDANNVINGSPAHASGQYMVSQFVMEERRRKSSRLSPPMPPRFYESPNWQPLTRTCRQ